MVLVRASSTSGQIRREPCNKNRWKVDGDALPLLCVKSYTPMEMARHGLINVDKIQSMVRSLLNMVTFKDHTVNKEDDVVDD